MTELGELQRLADEAGGNLGRGWWEWEQGRLSNHELGVLKRREKRAQLNLRNARYGEVE